MSKARLSNIELARMLSMFYILVIHANMVSLARPEQIDLVNNSCATIFRYLVESIGIISVNVFVLISGWFMINTRKSSVLSFVYQVVRLGGGLYVAMLLLGKTELSIKNILTCFSFTRWDWFIKSYLVLFILAPILNKFIANSSEMLQRKVIFWFFAFACSYGFIGGASRFFVSGYGPLFFIGLYLLAQYAHTTCNTEGTPSGIYKLFHMNKYVDLVVVLLCALVNTALGIFALRLDVPLYGYVYAYNNPLVVIGALYFLLFFSKVNIKQSKLINWLAASSFAVYLLHSQIDLRPYFTKGVNVIYSSNSGFSCVLWIFLFLVAVYLVSVVIDQIRILSWKCISKRIS